MTTTTPAPSDPDMVPGPALAADLRRAVTSTDPRHRSGRLVLQAHLPSRPPSTRAARALLEARGAVILGSAGTPAVGRLLYAAATDETWLRAADWFEQHPKPRPFTLVASSTAHLGLQPGLPLLTADGLTWWSACLHPAVDELEPAGRMPADRTQLRAFEDAVTRAGGRIGEARPMVVGTLTYLTVGLPDVDAARELARFNPLRSLQPVARIGLR